MSYAFVQLFPDYPPETYWRVVEELGDKPFEGLLAHLAGPYEGGWRILQVWRSVEDYARFERGSLLDALIAANAMQGASPPRIEWLDFDHVIVAGPADVRERDK
jgi:hypothetical protein